MFFFFLMVKEEWRILFQILETQYSSGLLPLLLFNYESSCKVPYPDLACFGKFNKPLWQKQGIAQRPLEFIWYLLPIPQGLPSDTHVDSLRTCRNFSKVLCIKKPSTLLALCLGNGSLFLFSSFLERLLLNRFINQKIFHHHLQSTVISYLSNKSISYSNMLSVRV